MFNRLKKQNLILNIYFQILNDNYVLSLSLPYENASLWDLKKKLNLPNLFVVHRIWLLSVKMIFSPISNHWYGSMEKTLF